MAFENLAIVVHQQIGAVAMQHAGPTRGQGGGVQPRTNPLACSLGTKDRDIAIIEEWMEQADGIRTATDTGHPHISFC